MQIVDSKGIINYRMHLESWWKVVIRCARSHRCKQFEIAICLQEQLTPCLFCMIYGWWSWASCLSFACQDLSAWKKRIFWGKKCKKYDIIAYWVIYHGYNRRIPFLGFSNLSTLCRHWYYGVDTHWLVAEAPLCLTEAAGKAQVLGWSNKQAFCFLQLMVAYSMHAWSARDICPVISRILIGWNSLSTV